MKVFTAPNIFTFFVLLAMGAAVIVATNYHFLAAIYPLVIGSIGTTLCFVFLLKNIFKKSEEEEGGTVDIEKDRDIPDSVRFKRAGKALVWILSLYLLIWLLGFKLGAIVFVALFVAVEAHSKWYFIIGLSAVLAVVLTIFQEVLNVFWPEGLLGEWLSEHLPWFF